MPPPQKPTARKQMMDFLARREHSEHEIREKLIQREYPTEEIEKALAFGRQKRWLPDSTAGFTELSEQMAQVLHKKNKGILFINQYLENKGLPAISPDENLEIEKALRCLETKSLQLTGDSDEAKKAKRSRLLTSRGFDPDVIRKVIK